MKNKSKLRIVIFSVLFVVLVAGLTVILFPHFKQLSDLEYQIQVQNWVKRMGFLGVLVMLGIQILQIIIAFIPGEPVELLAGVLYGTIGGMVICLLGCIFASTFIFALSKKFSKYALNTLFEQDKIRKWKWLQDSNKCELVTFILFFIPGTPKDMLTYLMGVTDMSVSKFVIISTIARIPSILSSTLIGSSILKEKWEVVITVFIIVGITGIIGISYKDKIISFCRKKSDKEDRQ